MSTENVVYILQKKLVLKDSEFLRENHFENIISLLNELSFNSAHWSNTVFIITDIYQYD